MSAISISLAPPPLACRAPTGEPDFVSDATGDPLVGLRPGEPLTGLISGSSSVSLPAPASCELALRELALELSALVLTDALCECTSSPLNACSRASRSLAARRVRPWECVDASTVSSSSSSSCSLPLPPSLGCLPSLSAVPRATAPWRYLSQMVRFPVLVLVDTNWWLRMYSTLCLMLMRARSSVPCREALRLTSVLFLAGWMSSSFR
mmetsp:Transcript_42812/g.107161  ORF Transcript_42812/g.107161 Transcript_42812/m.107161 type:complete len:208 (+) Transcript_42812:472-1095(+)